MRPAAAVVLCAVTIGACGGSGNPDAEHSIPSTASAAITIEGDLTSDQRELVEWAVGRLGTVDLQLPPRIMIEFADSAAPCSGHRAHCHPDHDPPMIEVCVPTGHTSYLDFRRTSALLHELAHLWHWRRGAGSWSDERAIVGGVIDDPDAPWEDRMEERVADVIAWGLLDQLRRPLRPELACASAYEQFVMLTSHGPLGPLEPVCVP